jgi:phosphohistidine phosphatase
LRKVFLVRHAEAEREKKGDMQDIDRSLTDRGKSDSLSMAKIVKPFIDGPAIILSSGAKRARQTARKFKKAIGEIEMIENGELYTGSSETIAAAIATTDDKYSSVMIVGHNPAIEEFMAAVRCTARMATSSVACFKVDCENWKELDLNKFKLEFLLKPSLLRKTK